jgi:UDP-glucose 4-epimerase
MLRILKKAKDIGIKKFVYASSGFLYGNTPNLPVGETEPFEYVTPYTVAKVAAENYLNFYKKTFNLPYVVVRYAAIYGPRQVTGAMADYIRKLAAGEQAEMWGDGNKTRDYVFVKDIVKANLMALDVSDNHPDPVFNIGTGKETTLNTLYNQIADILGKEAKPIYHPDRAGEQMRYCLDASKVKESIGWEPQYSLEKGLRETLRSWGHI